MTAQFLMTDPAHYAVSYRINPWMKPEAWSEAEGRIARAASAALAANLEALGAEVSWAPAAPGLPDLVFPANAAVVLDGKAVLARFRMPERQGEEARFAEAFAALQARGLVEHIVTLPEGCFHEGAGDAIWDRTRRLVWTGHGPRSSAEAGRHIAEAFGVEVVPLALATERFYHLDTCFCPLAGGQVLYYPPAFGPAALDAIRARVAPDDLIEAEDADAAAFCVNAISLNADIVMARAPARLKARLAERGYRVREVDLAPFILSGGAAFCMTLRLDLKSQFCAHAQPTETDHVRHPDRAALAS
ncbi:dimethylarginine dimethylaminohydrolase family protein [Caulobacter sp. KR2-114]|uniref:dimethylarginine dimethylaminohydrolase family protein n=1 Tax=Caulobacter sp. KR2-114 TaxID=3400912 RepID=UPI003C0583FC